MLGLAGVVVVTGLERGGGVVVMGEAVVVIVEVCGGGVVVESGHVCPPVGWIQPPGQV